MTEAWALRLLSSPHAPPHRVAGLPIALRLALDAQAAGAKCVVVSPELTSIREALADHRLRIPVVEAAGTDVGEVAVEAHWVVHRTLLSQAALEVASNDETRFVRVETSAPSPAPYGFSPIPVVDGGSARRAERALFRALRKPQDGWTSRWLNRYISLTISRWLVHTPLRPNQVSVGILGVGLLGAWLASGGGYWSLLLGASLFQAQSVLDGCDGELSRITHRGSLLGEWLDTVGDDLTNYGFFLGAAWGLYRTSGTAIYLGAGAVILFAGAIASGLEYRYLYRIGSGDLLKYPLSAQTSQGTGLLGRLQPLFKRDTFVFATFLAALAGLVGPMLFIFAAAAVGVFITVLATEWRIARQQAPAME